MYIYVADGNLFRLLLESGDSIYCDFPLDKLPVECCLTWNFQTRNFFKKKRLFLKKRLYM